MKQLVLILFLLVPLVLSANEALKKAESLTKSGKQDEALKVLNDVLVKDPQNVEALEAIQKIHLGRGKEPDVIAEYKARYEQSPSALNAHLYGDLLESPSERETFFREIRDEHPQEVWGYFGLANALLDQDRLQEAAYVTEEGVPYVRTPARLHYVAARIYRRMKEFGKAAEQASLAFQAAPSNEDYKSLVQSYEWIEVDETADSQKKLQLAKKYYDRYKKELFKGEEFGDAASLTELAFIFAESDAETTADLVSKAQKILRNMKPSKEPQDQELHTRVLASLFALQALSEATKGKKEKALELLKQATRAGEGSEAFYFTAVTHQRLGDHNAAVQEAIKAAVYPPAYAPSLALAEELWNKTHGSAAGLQEALARQKSVFAPQRRQRVLAQMISEGHKDYTLEDRDGKKVTRQELNGKVVLMNFWAVWCPPCREELPHWNAFYAKHKNDPALSLVAVGDEPWETMTGYMKNQNFNFAVYRNEDYWEQFDVSGIPTLLVIDASGKIRFRNVGFEEGMEYEETLEWQIEAAKGNRQ